MAARSNENTMQEETDMDDFKLSRRSLVKVAALAGVAQVASPFVITARAEDVVKIGLDNPLTGTYAADRQERDDRLPACGRTDQRQGRHPRPQGRAAGRGLDQRRRRHRGAEGAQADRPRQGQLPARQRELGARRWPWPTSPTRRASSWSTRAATPIRSPARTATGTSSASATPRRWKPMRWPAR